VSGSGNGVVENTDNLDAKDDFGVATLILSPQAGDSFSFGGYLRNAYTGGASNRVAIVMDGPGTQTLGGGNVTFTDGLTVHDGVLRLTGTTGFGSAATIDGGTLRLVTATAMNNKSVTVDAAGGLSFESATAFTIGGLGGSAGFGLTNTAGAAVTLSVGGGNTSGTYAGDLDGAGALTKTGTGTQVMSGNNTYAGATRVEQGVLTATKAAALPGYNSAGTVVVNAATVAVRTGGAGEWSGAEIDALLANATWNAGSMLGIDVTSGGIDLAGDIAGSQGLHKIGAGTLTLSGNNSYAGGTTVSGGILSFGAAANLPAGALNVTGGTLRVTGTSVANLDAYTLNAAGFRGGIDVDDASHTLTISQGLSGNGWLTKDGAGTLVLSGVNTFNGGVTNNAGTLRLANASAWAASNPLRLLGGDVDLAGYTVTMASLAGAAGTTITNNGGLTVNQGVEGTFAGAIVGSGGFTKAGGSILVLSGANTYSGLTVVNNGAGTLVLSNVAGNAIAGDLQLGNGTGGAAFLRLGADEQMPDTALIYFSGSGVNSRYLLAGFNETLGGIWDPSGYGIVENNDAEASLINAGPSTLTLNVAAGSNLVFSGYLRNYRSEGAGPSNTLTVVKTGAGTQILSGQNIGNGGLGGLVVQAGDLVLTNTIGLTTGVRVEGGRLVLASQTAINNRPITNNVAGGVAFKSGTAFSVGGLFGAGGITLTNETGAAVALTFGNGNTAGDFAGAFDGPGSVIKGGTAVFTLSGASSYAGLTTVNGGTLILAHGSALGSPAAGTVVAEGGQIVLTNGVTVTGEGLTIAGGGNNNMGALQAAAGSTATWAGTLTLGDLDDGGWVPRIGAAPDGILVVSGDIVDGVGTSLYISAQSGTGRVVVSGTNNTYSGRTGIVRGVLVIGRDETLPTGAHLDMNVAAVADPSTFDLNGYDQTVAGLRTISISAQSTVTNSSASPSRLIVHQASTGTYAGVIGGNLELVKSGAGTLTLQGDSTYSGTTSISGGVLRVNGSHAGGGLITVFSGGTLGGTGSVGAVSVQGGGVLGAGNSVGTMSFVGDVEILGSLAVENAGAAADLLAVTGHLTLGAGSVLDLLGTLDGLSSYTILTFTGTRTGTFGDVSDVTVQGYQVDYNANDVTLTVIPEPATLGLLGLCAAAVLLRRRLRA
jgi:autotransporter-associated beta strand protein